MWYCWLGAGIVVSLVAIFGMVTSFTTELTSIGPFLICIILLTMGIAAVAAAGFIRGEEKEESDRRPRLK